MWALAGVSRALYNATAIARGGKIGFPMFRFHLKVGFMAVFEYTWGTERPGVKEQRHHYNMTVRAELRRAALRAQYEAALAEVEEDVALEAREIEIVRLSTPGGRYNRDVAASVAAQFNLAASSEKVVRGRGRPRKYGPDDPRPARPSRAKTSSGRLRAAAMQFAGEGKRKVRASGSVSPVTASPARSVAPQAASAVGRALLVDTIAAKQDVAAAIDLVVTVSDQAIVSAAPAVPEAPAFDPRTAAERLNGYRLNALREFASGAEVTIDGEIVLAAYLQSHRRARHECASDWVRGQDGAKRHDYDFTDPADAEKVRPDIRALFKGFGLSRHEPSYDAKDPSRGMSDEDLQLWMKAAIFNGIDCPVADFDVYLQRYGSAKAYYLFDWEGLEPAIQEERERFAVWPFIERRLASVERRVQQFERGELDLNSAKARVMNDEVCFLGQLTWTKQPIYRKIVDAMTWFDGFSRLDLLAWAGDDPKHDRKCRIFQRFPGWAFPKELHPAVHDGRIFEEEARFEYGGPKPDELVAFAEKDDQGRIENLRNLSKLDFAEIET